MIVFKWLTRIERKAPLSSGPALMTADPFIWCVAMGLKKYLFGWMRLGLRTETTASPPAEAVIGFAWFAQHTAWLALQAHQQKLAAQYLAFKDETLTSLAFSAEMVAPAVNAINVAAILGHCTLIVKIEAAMVSNAPRGMTAADPV